MKTKIIIFLASLALWLLLSYSLGLEYILTGLVIGFFVVLMTADVFGDIQPWVFKNISRYPWFIYYIALFIWECIKANLDGAYRVIHPDLPMRPGIVKVKTQLKSEVGLTFLANSLTLTPGTMTVDVDKEGGFLYVHWVEVREQDTAKATELIVRKFERILLRIFP